jgi:hypothetical protein
VLSRRVVPSFVQGLPVEAALDPSIPVARAPQVRRLELSRERLQYRRREEARNRWTQMATVQAANAIQQNDRARVQLQALESAHQQAAVDRRRRVEAERTTYLLQLAEAAVAERNTQAAAAAAAPAPAAAAAAVAPATDGAAAGAPQATPPEAPGAPAVGAPTGGVGSGGEDQDAGTNPAAGGDDAPPPSFGTVASPPRPRRARLDHRDYRTIINMNQQGETSSQRIGQCLSIKESSVRSILSKYRRGKLNLNPAHPPSKPGRKSKLSQDHLLVASRYLQLQPRKTMANAAAFLKEHFPGLSVADCTLARNLRSTFGLRVADFKHIPTQRNQPEVIEARYH